MAAQDQHQALHAHRWTGNVRELRNVIERLIILCGPSISDDDVHQYVSPPVASRSRLHQLFDELENVDDLKNFVTQKWMAFKEEV